MSRLSSAASRSGAPASASARRSASAISSAGSRAWSGSAGRSMTSPAPTMTGMRSASISGFLVPDGQRIERFGAGRRRQQRVHLQRSQRRAERQRRIADACDRRRPPPGGRPPACRGSRRAAGRRAARRTSPSTSSGVTGSRRRAVSRSTSTQMPPRPTAMAGPQSGSRSTPTNSSTRHPRASARPARLRPRHRASPRGHWP